MILIAPSKLRQAVSELLEAGDVDGQPWAFYEHDHGGLKGHGWTKENATLERERFARALEDRLTAESYGAL